MPKPSKRSASGSDFELVYVSLRPDGTISNVRPISPDEHALRKAGIV